MQIDSQGASASLSETIDFQPYMSKLTQYFKDLRDIKNTGENVRETSFYGAFETRANAYGKELKPRVRCVIMRDTARRNAAILLSSDELDKNYLTAKVSNIVVNGSGN